MKKNISSSSPDLMTIVSLWIFPLCAMIITAWLLYDFYSAQGPLIEIVFDDAASVEPQRTLLRFRGITVGRVEKVYLSPDTKKVKVMARLTKEAKTIASQGSRFWIIHPQVSYEGIRGLETLLKGPYIKVEIGSGKPTRDFKGNIGDPELAQTQGAKSYILHAKEINSVDNGDAVTYRGLKVGSVSKVELAEKAQGVNVHITIEKQFSKLIRDQTAFWIKSAVDAKFGLLSADIKINSLDTIMRGGIALAVPNEPGEISPPQKVFRLQDTPPKDWISWSPAL